MSFYAIAALLLGYMLVLWGLRFVFKNDGLVDFGWPSSFFVLGLYFLNRNMDGNSVGAVFCLLYIACGIRFMAGWIERTVKHGEDPRWELWRQRWRAGEGVFGFKNVSLNFFFFYGTQQLANLTLIAFSMHLNTRDHIEFGPWQYCGLLLWVGSLLLESWADFDLWRFKRIPANRSKVCQSNLWKYSRHPNYFFEFLIWVSYVIFTWPAATTVSEHLLLLALIPMAYWFLVFFTGIPLTERRSRQSRGAAYEAYQRTTNRFWPWFRGDS